MFKLPADAFSLKNKYFICPSGVNLLNDLLDAESLCKKLALKGASFGQFNMKWITSSVSPESQSLQTRSLRGILCLLPFSISRSRVPNRNLQRSDLYFLDGIEFRYLAGSLTFFELFKSESLVSIETLSVDA